MDITSVFIMTQIHDYDCMSHEQNHITKGVYANIETAKDDGFSWLNSKSKACNTFQDELNLQHRRCVFLESHCGRYAVAITEHKLITDTVTA